jgi:demethylmenaquinone methyltransferase/2-methoxy-6-polyprenyl-1,4-benzoquinol methylase
VLKPISTDEIIINLLLVNMSKEAIVKEVFDSVADKYDLMNSLMSCGLHNIWKKKFISMIEPYHTHKLLDVAGGTGDIAMGFLDSGGGEAVICDINSKMLLAGEKKRMDNGKFNKYKGKLSTLCADVQQLPIENNSFDRVTISFGIRNVDDINAALREMHRVLKVGGKFLCMEFLRPEAETIMRRMYDFFSFHCIPAMGRIIVGDEKPYQYLVDSIRQFPKKDNFIKMIESAGFEMIKTNILIPDVVAIYTVYKLS